MAISEHLPSLLPAELVEADAIVVTGEDLTAREMVEVAREGAEVALAPQAKGRMATARDVLERAIESDAAVYGATTGVGSRKQVRVHPASAAAFNRLLIRAHRVGQGEAAPADVVRATMLRLANGFAKGTAGVRPELAERLVEALNAGAVPRVRMLGSIGQGDLAPLADLAHGLFSDMTLAPNEGLALVGSNAFSTALATLAVADLERLLDALDVAGALDLEAFAGNVSPFDAAVGESRPYPGLQSTAARIRSLLLGSYLWEEGAARNLQDPLSFRCLVQVHGAARDTLAFANRQLAIELNASQQNPLVVLGEDRILSVGNFDVLPLAAALDFLRVALAPVLTAASERSIKLLQASLSGLTNGLAARPGLAEDGLTELAVVAQALAGEARLLAQPVSFEPASSIHNEGIEDRMTLAPLAARRLSEMVSLGERLAAVELVVAAQAIDLRGRLPLGTGSGEAYRLVRSRVPFTGAGEALPQELEPVVELVRSNVGGTRFPPRAPSPGTA
jgi:histidine ammonia-lyase